MSTQLVKEKLSQLESMKHGPEYNALLDEVMTHLRKHNESEEQEDLPMLEREIGEEASAKAAKSFKTTKKFVPTRYVVALRMVGSYG